MKFLNIKLIRLLSLLIIIGLLTTQTNALNTFLKPRAVYASGDLTIDWGIGTGNVGPVFDIENMAPGVTQERNVEIKNNGSTTRMVGIKGVKTQETGNLSHAFDVVIKEGSTILYTKSLTQFFTESTQPEGIALNEIEPGKTKLYTITLHFKTEAGNEFQGKAITFNVVMGIRNAIPDACKSVDLRGKFPIYGTSKNDKLNGTNGDDVIFGLEGIDTVDGKNGNDCLVGGLGNDTLRGANGKDMLFGNEGNDDIYGDSENDYIYGQEGNDDIDGGSGSDEVYGGDGRDDIKGDSGNDRLFGGNDQDDIDGGSGNDVIEGGNEKDDLLGSAGNDTLIGGNGIDTADGHSGTDTCSAETRKRCEI